MTGKIQKLEDNILVIKSISSVFSHGMVKKHYDNTAKPRHSDCFVYILSGSAKYYFADRTFIVNKDNLLFLAKDSIYKIDVLTDDYLVVYVDFYFDVEPETSLISNVYTIKYKEIMKNTFKKLKIIWVAKHKTYPVESMAILYDIYLKFLKIFDARYLPGSYFRKIEKSHKYILENYYSGHINISTLAEISKMTEVHFRRLFKEIFNMPPVQYINNLRIERAKNLMLHGYEKTIGKIAEKCGYDDVYYFSKIFKKYTGLSPLNYMKITGG